MKSKMRDFFSRFGICCFLQRFSRCFLAPGICFYVLLCYGRWYDYVLCGVAWYPKPTECCFHRTKISQKLTRKQFAFTFPGECDNIIIAKNRNLLDTIRVICDGWSVVKRWNTICKNIRRESFYRSAIYIDILKQSIVAMGCFYEVDRIGVGFGRFRRDDNLSITIREW